MAGELDRIRRLAKAFAEAEGVTVTLYRKADGTYGFTSAVTDFEIIEYLTPY